MPRPAAGLTKEQLEIYTEWHNVITSGEHQRAAYLITRADYLWILHNFEEQFAQLLRLCHKLTLEDQKAKLLFGVPYTRPCHGYVEPEKYQALGRVLDVHVPRTDYLRGFKKYIKSGNVDKVNEYLNYDADGAATFRENKSQIACYLQEAITANEEKAQQFYPENLQKCAEKRKLLNKIAAIINARLLYEAGHRVTRQRPAP